MMPQANKAGPTGRFVSLKFSLTELESVAIMDKHAKKIGSALKEDRKCPRVDLNNYFLPLYNVTTSSDLFQEIATQEIRIGGLHQYSIATILFCSYFEQQGMTNTLSVTGIRHENGQWAIHGPDPGLMKAVARKAKTIPREHLHATKILVGGVVDYEEPEDESMSPCDLDGELGDVDSSCGPRLPPATTSVGKTEGNSVELLTPQPALSFTTQDNSKHPNITFVRGITPNTTKPKLMATDDNAEGPPVTPTIQSRRQQKEAGTPFMEGMDFNKRCTSKKPPQSTDETNTHEQNTRAQGWKRVTSTTIPGEERVAKPRKEEDCQT